MLLSAYNLLRRRGERSVLRVEPLRAIAGDNILASPVVGMTHGVVMMVFTLLIVFYVIASMVRGSSRFARAPSADPAR